MAKIDRQNFFYLDFLVLANKPIVHSGRVNRGRVCCCGCWICCLSFIFLIYLHTSRELVSPGCGIFDIHMIEMTAEAKHYSLWLVCLSLCTNSQQNQADHRQSYPNVKLSKKPIDFSRSKQSNSQANEEEKIFLRKRFFFLTYCVSFFRYNCSVNIAEKIFFFISVFMLPSNLYLCVPNCVLVSDCLIFCVCGSQAPAPEFHDGLCVCLTTPLGIETWLSLSSAALYEDCISGGRSHSQRRDRSTGIEEWVYCGTPPLKVGARPRSETIATEKAIFHLLPRQLSWNKSHWIWLGTNWVLALKKHYKHHIPLQQDILSECDFYKKI